ncbi:MAG: formate dehydrogenase accessory protein FdhE [Thermodesulfovibrionales bacterium]
MSVSIDEIIEKKPHLKDTLRLYEKVIRFTGAIRELPLLSNIDKNPIGPEDLTYPSKLIKPIFDAFSAIFDMPEESLEPLKEAMRLGQIDLTRLPLKETPAFLLPYYEDELTTILFLISKPYFLWLRDSCNLDGTFYQEGRCPVCNSIPSMASIAEDGKRRLYCSFCGTTGYYKRIGCPACLNEDTSAMDIITVEEEKGFRINTCNACGSYLKTVDAGLLNDLSPDLADLISLPLDIIAQERGFRRHSPNPIGIINML